MVDWCFLVAGNINNVLYNEGACGRYAIILDNDMKPHPMFIQATLPFFFDSPASTKTFRCRAPGCSDIAKITCTLCVQAGVPEATISYCSNDCFVASNHVHSQVHRRQARTSKVNRTTCTTCGGKVDLKSGTCSGCKKAMGRRTSVGTQEAAQYALAMGDHYNDDVQNNQVG
ncbi:hypothetical protein DYB37_007473 [Aphanomyces astaci]|nr:hypothetical protein DYB37_007473 [Aphanomyces astaci]